MSDDDDAVCWTVREFCVLHKISESAYYRMRRVGTAPKEILVGRRVLITREAAARWRKERLREVAK
jgi:predicted DNA-binding transcriptional regulator AlpA